MAARTPAGVFAWLDHDDRESQRIRELLRAFEEKGTVDSLGLGVVRDAFSDLLFPGTSTIQTRARYFIFVPWLFQQLERERVPPANLWSRVRRSEVELIGALREGVGSSEQGVIGYYSGDRTQRLPSSVYWNGLARLGIRHNDFTMSEYRRRLPEAYRLSTHQLRDDDGNRVGTASGNWDPNLPRAPDGFPRAVIDFTMTREEADYLADRIRIGAEGSLFALIVDAPDEARTAAPWRVALSGASDGVRRVVDHARNFAVTMHGAQLLYNRLLADQAAEWFDQRHEDFASGIEVDCSRWVRAVKDLRGELEHWLGDIAGFWATVGRPVPWPTRAFVESWAEAAVADPRAALEDARMRDRVLERERGLKGPLARLSNRAVLERWAGQRLGSDLMTYRWVQAARIVGDIAAARD